MEALMIVLLAIGIMYGLGYATHKMIERLEDDKF